MKTNRRQPPPDRRSRRIRRLEGYTLIEVLFVLTITGAVLGTTVRLVSIAQRSHESSKGSLLQRQEIRRFADDLRDDMHRTQSHTIKSDAIVLLKETDDADRIEITYQVELNTIIRRTANQESQTPTSSDFYTFESSAKIELKPGETDSLVECIIAAHPAEETPFRIQATHGVTP